MATDKKNQSLGEYVRAGRQSKNWTLEQAGQRSGLDFSYWSRLENGLYDSPSPKHLLAIARTLDVPVEDLYALAGYVIPERLPSFRPYMRATRPGLTAEDVRQVELFMEFLRQQRGLKKGERVFETRAESNIRNKAPRAKKASQRKQDDHRRAA